MFVKGSTYTRHYIWKFYHPNKNIPNGGTLFTGYHREKDDLLIFMNIGVPGATGHDFPNRYNKKNKTITWFGKPKSHSLQPTFQKLISGELTSHFFARWSKKSDFTYLGIGTIIKYKDDILVKSFNKGYDTSVIKVTLSIAGVDDVIATIPTENKEILNERVNHLLSNNLFQNTNHNPKGNKQPTKRSSKSTQYIRCPKVVAAILSIANGKCENCKINAPFIKKKDNQPYLEVHHIKRLADKGSDTITNAVAVCPNCHKALHYANNSEELSANLINTIDRLIKE